MPNADSSQPIGFIPRFPAPAKYIRVRAHHKKEKTFARVFVAQELEGSGEASHLEENKSSASSVVGESGKNPGKAVWSLEFSSDGRYLASAGQDGKVRVWGVISSTEDRDAEESLNQGQDDANDDHGPPRLRAPVFKTTPVQVYEGHTGSILDLSWSKVRSLLATVTGLG